jgi:hypothetical protein
MTVTLPYDPDWKALEWAKEHCSSYITNDLHQDGYNDKIDYHFGDEKDAVMFALRWSK